MKKDTAYSFGRGHEAFLHGQRGDWQVVIIHYFGARPMGSEVHNFRTKEKAVNFAKELGVTRA